MKNHRIIIILCILLFSTILACNETTSDRGVDSQPSWDGSCYTLQLSCAGSKVISVQVISYDVISLPNGKSKLTYTTPIPIRITREVVYDTNKCAVSVHTRSKYCW